MTLSGELGPAHAQARDQEGIILSSLCVKRLLRKRELEFEAYGSWHLDIGKQGECDGAGLEMHYVGCSYG